jgi:hypothetical protein
VHGNNKLSQDKSTALLSIGKLPYSSQRLIWQTGLLKDGSGLVTRKLATLKGLTFK